MILLINPYYYSDDEFCYWSSLIENSILHNFYDMGSGLYQSDSGRLFPIK